jgi:uncharacterized RDD family membrane protein YckC
MKWYYADGGRQVGPVEEAALDDLVRAGAVRDDTLIWCEGMANWQPHGSVRGAKHTAPMPAIPTGAGTSFCSECGRPFPSDQLVMVGNASVCALCKPIYLQRLQEGGAPVGARRYGGFWIRFVARLIDGILLLVVGLVIRIPLMMMIPLARGPVGVDPGALAAMIGMVGISGLIQIAFGLAYEVYFLTTRGATLGKQALGLRVIRFDGSGISTGVAVGRFFAQYLSGFILLIGYIMAGFDDQKRSLHDRICDTRVIHTN